MGSLLIFFMFLIFLFLLQLTNVTEVGKKMEPDSSSPHHSVAPQPQLVATVSITKRPMTVSVCLAVASLAEEMSVQGLRAFGHLISQLMVCKHNES